MRARRIRFGGHHYTVDPESKVLAAHPEALEALWAAPAGVITVGDSRGFPPYAHVSFYLNAEDACLSL
jgi:hypothetical protein